MRPPSVSIIVVSHNREEQLLRCIRLISRLDRSGVELELVVVLDSCSDRSSESLDRLRGEVPFRIKRDNISKAHPAAARNHGARLASGAVLLFLDDDVLPEDQLLKAHLASLADSDAVVGYLKPLLGDRPDWWQLGARIWWEDRYSRMRSAGYKLGYRDLFSANFSIKSSLFRSCGMFDEATPRLEDYELGIRLVKNGAALTHNPVAIAFHREDGHLGRWISRTRLEAEAEVYIGKKHPDFRREVFKVRLEGETPRVTHWKSRLRSIAFRRKTAINALMKVARSTLPILEGMKARKTWRHVMGAVHEYLYWQAIAGQFRTESEFLSWVHES
jgi:GT2 family glycosyltransferase